MTAAASVARDDALPLDCLIIGGGPAGLTASIYLARFRLSIRIVDAKQSRAALIPHTRNHAGFPGGIPCSKILSWRLGIVLREGFQLPPDRFSEFMTLAADEQETVRALATETLRCDRRSIIRNEGAVVQYVYLLIEGWVTSSMTLKDGARQFFKVHIPGDVLGAPSLASPNAVETLTAITSCIIKCIPVSRLGAIFAEHPRLGMSLFLSANKERIALMDMLAAVARMSAISRLARFLIDLHDRLLDAGQTEKSRLPMPMTQEEIADLLGLTPVHVNRMLRELEGRALLRRNGKNFLLDLAGLEAMNLISSRTYVREPLWLPSVKN